MNVRNEIVVAHRHSKFMTWAPVEFWFFYHVYYMNFNKAVFRHVVLNNLSNGPWRALALIACTNFSLET